jgi:hypothetical protein
VPKNQRFQQWYASMNLFLCCPLRFTAGLRQRGGFANYLFFLIVEMQNTFTNLK